MKRAPTALVYNERDMLAVDCTDKLARLLVSPLPTPSFIYLQRWPNLAMFNLLSGNKIPSVQKRHRYA
jgi:hypothetical protein